MPLINCKVELKPKWTKHSVLSRAGADNNNADANNIIFTMKDTKLYAPVVTLSVKDNQIESLLEWISNKKWEKKYDKWT